MPPWRFRAKERYTSKEGTLNFYEFTFGTDDPKVRYVHPDGFAPSIAIQIDGSASTPSSIVAKISVSANADEDNKVVDGCFMFLDSDQLRKLARDAARAADLLDN